MTANRPQLYIVSFNNNAYINASYTARVQNTGRFDKCCSLNFKATMLKHANLWADFTTAQDSKVSAQARNMLVSQPMDSMRLDTTVSYIFAYMLLLKKFYIFLWRRLRSFFLPISYASSSVEVNDFSLHTDKAAALKHSFGVQPSMVKR